MVIGDDLKGGEHNNWRHVHEEHEPAPVAREQASRQVVQDYYSEVGTDVLCPEILLFTIAKDIVSIGELGNAIHKEGLEDTDGGPGEKLFRSK